jgi:hypothetical protein
MNWAEQVNRDGYRVIPAVVHKAVVGDLLERLTESELPRSRAGVRHMMRDRWVAEIAAGREMDCTRNFRPSRDAF